MTQVGYCSTTWAVCRYSLPMMSNPWVCSPWVWHHRQTVSGIQPLWLGNNLYLCPK